MGCDLRRSAESLFLECGFYPHAAGVGPGIARAQLCHGRNSPTCLTNDRESSITIASSEHRILIHFCQELTEAGTQTKSMVVRGRYPAILNRTNWIRKQRSRVVHTMSSIIDFTNTDKKWDADI